MAILKPKLKDEAKEKLRFVKNYPLMRLFISEKKWFLYRIIERLQSDEVFIRKKYKKAFGQDLDLDNPKTFNEKLQWLKLYYRDPKMAICADKYEVRNYLSEKGFGNLLNTLHGAYEKTEDVDFSKLPDRFIMKASHGSGWNIVCNSKSEFNWSGWSKVMDSWLKQNLYVYGREWVYKEIKPRILCEKYFEVNNGTLFDYKFFCFNGKVVFIQANENLGKRMFVDLYDIEWNLMNVKKHFYKNTYNKIPKPKKLPKMIEIAENLSKPFPFVRIDLYDVNGNIVFGEYTFFPSSGFKGFEPKEFDIELGEKLNLACQ